MASPQSVNQVVNLGARSRPPKPKSTVASCSEQGLKIGAADALTTALKPDEALAICRTVIQTPCEPSKEEKQQAKAGQINLVEQTDMQQAAAACLKGAIAEKSALAIIDSRMEVISLDLGRGSRKEATAVAAQLTQNLKTNLDNCKDAQLCKDRVRELKTYTDNKLAKLDAYNTYPDVWYLPPLKNEYAAHATELIRWISPAVATLPAILWGLIKLSLFLIGIFILLRWTLPWLVPRIETFFANQTPEKFPYDSYKVWSISDPKSMGASGAVMEALDMAMNPLSGPLLRGGLDGILARSRRQFLLAPPFQHAITSAHTHRNFLLLVDFLGSGTEGNSAIEYLPAIFKTPIILPEFESSESFDREEFDLTFGSYKLAGLAPLFTRVYRFYWRKFPSVVGLVDNHGDTEKPTWEVRLTCKQPEREAKQAGGKQPEQVASVFAKGSPTRYGDPLATVAQRAAFKLFLRILTPPMIGPDSTANPTLTTDQITAIALYRQGIQLLMQLV